MDTVALFGGVSIGDTWNVSIHAADLGGSPTGPALATASAPAPVVLGWTEMPLIPPVPVVAGTMYAIVVAFPTPQWRITFPGPYAGGVFANGGDGAFRTFVTVVPPEPPFASILVENTVATSETGPSGESVAAPTGSTVWRTIRVINNGMTRIAGIALVDSGGALPATCPSFRPSLQIGEMYSCTFSVPVVSGTTVYATNATSGNLTSGARAYVTGTLSAIAVGSKLGGPRSPGNFTPDTKVAALGGYVTWQADLGPGAAGKIVGVYVSRKGVDGSWGSWTRLTARSADAAGIVSFSRRELNPAWLSVRFSLDGDSFTSAAQARWR